MIRDAWDEDDDAGRSRRGMVDEDDDARRSRRGMVDEDDDARRSLPEACEMMGSTNCRWRMMMSHRYWLSAKVLMLVFGSVACGGSAPTTEAKAPQNGPLAGELVDATGKPAPKWVTAPATYKKDADGNKVVCGEGSISSTSNMNLAQSTATARARTALARTLETKVKAMVKDYQATTTGGGQFKSAADDEQAVVDASKQITSTTLSGTEVTDTWISSTSTLHQLVCLNVERFKEVVSGMKHLNDSIRQAVQQRADKAWDEVDAIQN